MSVLAALTRLDDATDGQLLGRFVQSRDADAFAALVRRLGPRFWPSVGGAARTPT